MHNYFYSKANNQANSLSSDYDVNAAGFSSRFHSRCQKCDNNDKRYAHPAEYLNDYNNQGNITWWQSETMLEGIQYPTTVNLTLNLGKSFDINYVQVKFHSPRPESFAIYKRTRDENADWEPYQYYSSSCLESYGVQQGQIVTHKNEAIALCTDEFSDIAPLTGASVVFGTLEDRPSAYNFENSEALKEWVTASDIRISLNRLNTFGDEVFNDPQVLKSYYYAISDIAVGGRCKCNGHASKCEFETGHDFEDRLKCQCEHNTDGVDCELCKPFYNDVPWEPATVLSGNDCKPCNCNGLSKKCHFNQTLYDLTGRGGYCDDCDGNTGGPHCEECKHGFYRRENENACVDCQCNPFGSESLQCDPAGKCKCRPGVIGEKCDRCAPYHYDLSIVGCKVCNCNPIGSFDTPPICDPRDGSCRCKANVESQNCDRPKPGFFHLAEENINGAIPCFCYGHSSTCQSSDNYFRYNLTSNMNENTLKKWKAIDALGKMTDAILETSSAIGVNIQNVIDDVWFLVSGEFLGNQQLSYNQDLSFDLKIISTLSPQQGGSQAFARPSRKDIVLESSHYKLEVCLPIYGGSSSRPNPNLPTSESQRFAFKLNQHSGWMPSMNANDFQRLLSNLSSIKIRASYAPSTRAILSNISMGSAKLLTQATLIESSKELQPALFVELCSCPIGHVGQQCETCDEGYRRDPPNGGPFSRCVPCTCNNHSESCDQETGKCSCIHYTSGDNCEKCLEGYFGNPILDLNLDYNNNYNEVDLSNMCKKCPCPNDGPCVEIYNYQLKSNEVVCLGCAVGTQGNLCELCDDGYYKSGSSVSSPCEKCTCNGNIDDNSIGNCDTTSRTGKCLRCVYNTTGDSCEKCLPNYWGNALTPTKCHGCECNRLGTVRKEGSTEPKQCNLTDGKCECKPNVKNRQCNECVEGFWNLKSNEGCEECKCNPLGSFNLSCSSNTGQCFCRPGVQGLKCDTCMPYWYGFSDEGCKKCNCDQFGTQFNNLQCDDFGKCACRENFAGSKCDQCDENRYNFTSGCLKCEECYNLVQTQVKLLRSKIEIIQLSLNQMIAANGNGSSNYLTNQNMELQKKLNALQKSIGKLHDSLYSKNELKSNYRDSVAYLNSELKRINEAVKSTDQSFEQFNLVFRKAEKLYNEVNVSVDKANTQVNFIGKKNAEQNKQIDVVVQGRIDYEQNDRLPNLAKQSREAAEKQKETAQSISNELKKSIQAAHAAFKDLQELLIRYKSLDDDRKGEIFTFPYDELKNSADNLAMDALNQKVELEKSVKDYNLLIDKIKNFKIPEARLKDAEAQTEETEKFVKEISSKSSAIKTKVEDLKNKFETFINADSLSSIGSAQTQLNSAKIKQKDLDYLFQLAERIRNQSNSATNLANEVYNNATTISNTLEKFDQLVSDGKDKLKQAEGLKSLTEINIKDSRDKLRMTQEKLRNLNNNLEELKRTSSKSNSILNEANKSLEDLEQKVNSLKNLTAKLDATAAQMVQTYETNTQSKVKEALKIHSSLDARNDVILKQAEKVTNGTQKLLDNANNALESLNKINRSISEFSVANIKREDITRLQKKFEKLSLELDSDTQIDESISNLEKNTRNLLNTAKQYKYQVDFLRKQIENLENINDSLERRCFSNKITKPEL